MLLCVCTLAGLDGNTGCRAAVCQQFAHSCITAYATTWAAGNAAAGMLATVCVRVGMAVLTQFGGDHIWCSGGGCNDHMLATRTAGKAEWLLRLVLDCIHASPWKANSPAKCGMHSKLGKLAISLVALCNAMAWVACHLPLCAR